VPLAEVVLDRALLGRRRLGECGAATERSSKRAVLHAHNAHVCRATRSALARHAGGHLHLDGEVHDGRGAEASNANTGHVLGNLCGLEGCGVGAARGSVDHCGQRTSAVLVDLVECHGDCAVVGRGREAGRGARTGGGSDARLRGTLGGLCASGGGAAGFACTAGKGVEEAAGSGGSGLLGAFGGGGTCGTSGGSGGSSSSGSGAHEGRDGSCGVDGAGLGAAESRSFAAAHLAGADDGSVGLRAAAGSRAVTGSTVLDCNVLASCM
jgi:hypothetical protein